MKILLIFLGTFILCGDGGYIISALKVILKDLQHLRTIFIIAKDFFYIALLSCIAYPKHTDHIRSTIVAEGNYFDIAQISHLHSLYLLENVR